MVEIILIIVLTIFLIIFLFVENYYYKKIRSKIKLVIHVNGTRGKSTVTRMIGAGLRNAGYKVFTKTTGTLPMYVDVNGEEKQIRRLGKASIREQLKILRIAAKQQADVLVIECMAVTPELQKISEEKMLQANYTVITNVLSDHLDVMGKDLDSIASAMANTIPSNGDLIVIDEEFNHIFTPVCNKKNTNIWVAEKVEQENNFDTFIENVELSLEVAKRLEVDQKLFLEGLKNYPKDPGSYTQYQLDGTTFYNGFSLNDPDSIIRVYNDIIKKVDPIDLTIVLNIRDDRHFRTEQHIKLLNDIQFKEVIVTGDNIEYVLRILRKNNILCHRYQGIDILLTRKYIFGTGNFYNNGQKILSYFKKHGVEL